MCVREVGSGAGSSSVAHTALPLMSILQLGDLKQSPDLTDSCYVMRPRIIAAVFTTSDVVALL